jgi:hypothetical protein
LLRSTGYKEGGGALRKREVLMGLVSGGILGKIGEPFPIIFPLKWGMAFTFISGMIICWCGDSALKCSFPEFFALARDKEALVSEYMDRSSPHTLWNLNFMRDVHDWKIESLDFFSLFYTL